MGITFLEKFEGMTFLEKFEGITFLKKFEGITFLEKFEGITFWEKFEVYLRKFEGKFDGCFRKFEINCKKISEIYEKLLNKI